MPGNIQTPPLPVIASWPKPNFINPVRREWLPPYTIVLQCIASFLVALRLVLRFTDNGGGLGLDDAFLLPGWLLSIGLTVAAIDASNEGMADRHVWDLHETQYSKMALITWIAEFFFLLGTLCVKISVMLFYRRLVRRSISRSWRIAVWAAIVFTVAWTFGLILALIINCEPTKAYWMAYDISWTLTHTYHCTDTKWINSLTGALTIISDVYAVVLPCLLLRKLKMERRQKLQLDFLFGLGLIVSVVAALRTWMMVRLGTEYDLTWLGFEAYIFSLTEYELGIIVACLPALRALCKLLAERLHPRGDIQRRITSSPSNEVLDIWEAMKDQPRHDMESIKR